MLEMLTFSLPVSCWVGANTNLPSNSNISKTVRVRIKNHLKFPDLVNIVSSNFNKSQIFFLFFTENLTLSLLVPYWAGANTNLVLNSNIFKTARVNIALKETFFIEYLISFLLTCRLIEHLWFSSY